MVLKWYCPNCGKEQDDSVEQINSSSGSNALLGVLLNEIEMAEEIQVHSHALLKTESNGQ